MEYKVTRRQKESVYVTVPVTTLITLTEGWAHSPIPKWVREAGHLECYAYVKEGADEKALVLASILTRLTHWSKEAINTRKHDNLSAKMYCKYAIEMGFDVSALGLLEEVGIRHMRDGHIMSHEEVMAWLEATTVERAEEHAKWLEEENSGWGGDGGYGGHHE